MLVAMTKVAVVGHRAALDETIETIHELGSLHVVDAATVPGLGGSPMALSAARAEDLERLRALHNRIGVLAALRERTDLSPPKVSAEPERTFDLDVVAERLDALLPVAEKLAQRVDALESEQAALPRHLTALKQLAPLAPDLAETESYETVALMIDRQHANVIEALREEVDRITERKFELITGIVDRDTVGALLIYPRSRSGEVQGLLGSGQVSRVRLPSGYEGLSFGESLARMTARLEAIPDEIANTRASIAELLSDDLDLTAARRGVEARIDRIELYEQLGSSERTFCVVGWLPRDALAELRATLGDDDGAPVTVVELPADEGDEPPALMHNHAVAQPFERLVSLFGQPKSRGIDPSGLMSVFMPLFFGMMLGDIGYGAVLLLLSLWARRRATGHPVVADISRILGLGAVWAIVWGVLFGELFGDLGERYLHLHALWLPRGEARAIGPLLIFALGVGAAHVTLGLVLGIFSAWRQRHRDELTERIGLLVAMAGLFLLAGVVADRLPLGLMTVSVAALVVGTVLVGITKGSLGLLMGPLEVISGLGNVLSYLRIAAIGLASVYLARVANQLAVEAPVVLGVVVAVLLHTLNLALGAFSPTIQALRLHYVEFFGKFYDEGGAPYRPFGGSFRHDDADTLPR